MGNALIYLYRSKIDSSAVNLSLKELIDRFAKQRSAVSDDY